ncbi:CvpA family protein [Acinetobacter shaoyimingii]|uniref:CvpA family protein n=1 Tax=Acinetobacter shaoyimingii TaxID=2715164 RepID=A0A6G8RWR3_9GAMM|nr:CvpA family protein [Acinetobacter shaoyimingii]NHB57091.1 CvpA family protein [Acinetobacter shaoyimingii]QIO06290.1 CvpA family protein [Acinetobacter shaoyimingii]
MNYIDIFILIILLIGGLNGLRHGFVKALANFIGWIFALIVGAKYANVVAPAMSALSQDPVVQKIAAFAFIVMVIIVCTWIVTALLNGILKTLKLGPLNRLAGGAFGALKGLMIVLITMQGLGSFFDSSPQWKQSKFIQALLPFAPMATELSKETANKALSHIKSDDSTERNRDFETDQNHSKNSEDSSSHSTKNPFY